MKDVAALITSIAALLAAVAWPASLVILVFVFRSQVRAAFEKLPVFISRMRSVKVAGFEAELRSETEPLIDQAVANPGDISPQQIRSAARILVESKSVNTQVLRDQVQQLCIEYETLRKHLKPGNERTRAMTDVFVRMRTLGPAISSSLEEMKISSAAGNRLAAVAVMQIQPEKADFEWLTNRFRYDAPFIFFHAGHALRAAMDSEDQSLVEGAKQAARNALSIMDEFKGVKDASSIAVLQAIIEA